MKKYIPILPVLMLGGLAFTLASDASAARPEVELDDIAVFIEWNSTDTDYGLQIFWDSDGFTKMKVSNHRGKTVLDVKTKKNVKEQGLTEGFFESVEPPAAEVSMEQFFDRFPEGDYKFKGKGVDGEKLVGETELTHDLLTPLTNLMPNTGDTVSRNGFTASFDALAEDVDGNPLGIEFFELVVESEEDEPILRVFRVILVPTQTSVFVPGEFLEPDTSYKLEIIAQEASGNRTITETGFFTTDSAP